MSLQTLTLDLAKITAYTPQTPTIRQNDAGESLPIILGRGGESIDLTKSVVTLYLEKSSGKIIQVSSDTAPDAWTINDDGTMSVVLPPETYQAHGDIKVGYLRIKTGDVVESTSSFSIRVLPAKGSPEADDSYISDAAKIVGDIKSKDAAAQVVLEQTRAKYTELDTALATATKAANQAVEAAKSATAATKATITATNDATKATQAANDATTAATTATDAAKTATANADDATAKAIQATGEAQTATKSATDATAASQTATTAAINATDAAKTATDATVKATTAATTAMTESTKATQNAVQATTDAQTATSKANDAAKSATDAAGKATDATADTIEIKKSTEDLLAKIPTDPNYKGPKGDTGSGLELKGTTPPEVGEKDGDTYLVDGRLVVWQDGKWADGGQVQGPKGDKGDQGDTPELTGVVRSATVNGDQVMPDDAGNLAITTPTTDLSGLVRTATVNGGEQVVPDDAGNLAITTPDPDLSGLATKEAVTTGVNTAKEYTDQQTVGLPKSWFGTLAEYQALGEYDDFTIYYILSGYEVVVK